MPFPSLSDPLCRARLKLVGLDGNSMAWQTVRYLREQPRWDKERLAAELGMSGRHLVRKLNREGLTFRQLRNVVRVELAAERIAAGVALADVAAELGFYDERAFVRAFHRWTGVAPEHFGHSD